MQTPSQNLINTAREAAEAAVMRLLAGTSLINQDQPPAQAESAQNATESVAEFTHTYRAPDIQSAWGDVTTAVFEDLDTFILTIENGCDAARIDVILRSDQIAKKHVIGIVTVKLSSDQLEESAKNFLDAAHHLRQKNAKQQGSAA